MLFKPVQTMIQNHPKIKIEQSPFLFLYNKYKQQILEQYQLYGKRAPSQIRYASFDEKTRVKQILIGKDKFSQIPVLREEFFRNAYYKNLKIAQKYYNERIQIEDSLISEAFEKMKKKETFHNEENMYPFMDNILDSLRHCKRESFIDYEIKRNQEVNPKEKLIKIEYAFGKKNSNCLQSLQVLEEVKSIKYIARELLYTGDNFSQNEIITYLEKALIQGVIYADHHFVTRHLRYPLIVIGCQFYPQQSILYCGRKKVLMIPQYTQIFKKKVREKSFESDDIIQTMAYELTNLQIATSLQDPNIALSKNEMSQYLYNETKHFFND